MDLAGGDQMWTHIAILGTVIVIFAVFMSKRKEAGGRAEPALWHSTKAKPFLDKTKRQSVVLREREYVTHDVLRLRFALPAGSCLGLPVGKATKFFVPNIAHSQQATEWNPRPARGDSPRVPRDPGSGEGDVDKKTGEWKPEIVRKYTPCTLDSDIGYFDYMVKIYRKGTSNIFPQGGKCSQFLESLSIGDAVEIQGPFGLLEYLGRSKWKRYGKRRHIGLIAGGSGVTPMVQVIRAVLSDPEDRSELSLIYANKTSDDIIIKDLLDQWAADSDGRFKVHYTLDNPPEEGWSGSKGFVTADMISAHLPPPGDDTLVLMCGPPPMIKFACKPNLEKLGYDMRGQVASF